MELGTEPGSSGSISPAPEHQVCPSTRFQAGGAAWSPKTLTVVIVTEVAAYGQEVLLFLKIQCILEIGSLLPEWGV